MTGFSVPLTPVWSDEMSCARGLGHLLHRRRRQRPQEMGVMLDQMALSRVEEFRVGVACETCPALAVRSPLCLYDRSRRESLIHEPQNAR